MPYVHSLVKMESNGREGWCAPAELGEASPQYVSFVIPVDDRRRFFDEYFCEAITTENGDKRTATHELVKEGKDSFILHVGKLDVWFTTRAGPKGEHRLPYIGKLQHDDFALMFVEIEPEEPDKLDSLFDRDRTFIIGCEPFAHYAGIKGLSKKRS